MCDAPRRDIDRDISIRSNGSVSVATVRNERSFAKYVKASIGGIPLNEVTSDDIEECLLKVPELSEKWALEQRRAREENRKTAEWARKHATHAKPFKPIKVAGPDKQAKILKLLREVMNYALEKDDIVKNVAKAKFLTRVFKKSRPLIDPLMADDAARFLHEVELLPVGFVKLSLLLLNTGMRPEEMLAVRTGNIIFGEDETLIKITGVVSRNGKEIVDYPKSDASRRSVPVDAYTADVAKQ